MKEGGVVLWRCLSAGEPWFRARAAGLFNLFQQFYLHYHSHNCGTGPHRVLQLLGGADVTIASGNQHIIVIHWIAGGQRT